MTQHCIIYGLFDPRTDQLRYIGKSVNGIARAKARHAAHCECWRKSLRVLGLRPIIRVLETVSDPSLLSEREIFWIRTSRENGIDLTNITDGGEGTSGKKLSPEHRAKLLAANTGRVCSPETRAKISAGNRGKQRTPETLEKYHLAHIGKKASPETRAKMSAAHSGRAKSDAHKAALAVSWRDHHTEESFEKIAASKRGKSRDAETKSKISQKLKGKPWSEARRRAHELLKLESARVNDA